MSHSFATRTFIFILLLASGAWATWGSFHTYELPFSLGIVDARTAVVHANHGTSLPPGIHAGDRIDLKALDSSARSAIAIYDMQGALPAEQSYQFVIRRG